MGKIVYVDFLDSWLDVLSEKWPRWFRWWWYLLCNLFGVVKRDENCLTIFCIKSDLINDKCLKNLSKKLTKSGSKTVACAEGLLNNDKIAQFLQSAGYVILDGGWLYRFLPFDILKKISYVKNVDISKLEVSILSNEDSDIVIENIKLIGKNCKILNVVTDNYDNFFDLEEFFMKDYGILINVTSNRKKSLLHSDVVFNFDFNKEQLKLCNMNKECILVQVNKEEFERREGVTICSCKLKLPGKYLKFFDEYKNFSEEILYESLVYSRISFENMRRILEGDCVGIRYFVGNNGKIDFNEIRDSLQRNN